MKIKIISFFCFLPLLLLFNSKSTFSSNLTPDAKSNTQEFVNADYLKTVKIRKVGTNYSIPAIELNAGEFIELIFDDLSETPGNYSYTLTHCTDNWEPSPLFYTDYMQGFEINEVRDYQFSRGTDLDYMHCNITLPNDDVRMRVSGNYLLRVFDSYSPEVILIQKRFIVYENIVGFEVEIKQPSAGEMRYTGQQLNLTLNTAHLKVSDPFNELQTLVCQNQLFQGCYNNVKPEFIRGNEISYSHPQSLIFNGGNEYRTFEIHNIRYPGIGVTDITYQGGMFHALLNTDKGRRNEKYSSRPDFNGYYAVNVERSSNAHTEADYVQVYFTLRTPVELQPQEKVYLFGELTNWMLAPANQMAYSSTDGAYQLSLLLKQGAYNYAFVMANTKTGEVDFSHFEGSFFDTENLYTIIVYYKPLGARYHRVVGVNQIRS